MADGFDFLLGGIKSIGGAIQAGETADSLRISEEGFKLEAESYRKGSAAARESGRLSEVSTRVQTIQADRKINRTLGAQQATAAAAGFEASGSNLDLLRDSTAQGHMTDQMIGLQGEINANAFEQQALASDAQAVAADVAAKNAEAGAKAAETGGIIQGIAGVASIGKFLFGLF